MLPSRTSGDQFLERVARLCARAQDPLELFEQVAALVRKQVPYSAAGWILIDPDTMLINGVYGEGVDRGLHLELIACELTEDDVNKFCDLADLGIPAVALSASTDGDLARSTRWARFYGPNGYGDELRAVFATGQVAWGHACLTRRAGDPFFTRSQVALVGRISHHVGNGIRAGYLLGDLTGADPVDNPAVVLLTDDGTVASVTPQALDWLGSPEDPTLATTVVLHEVAAQTRALAEGNSVGPPAFARARARTGDWLVVRGTRLTDNGRSDNGHAPTGVTALVVEPARRADLAPMLLGLHGLTDREREVTQLLLRGLSTSAIAQSLWISPETLHGHVKSVFAKLGVVSRPELAAMLSHEPRSRVRPDEPVGPHSR